MTAATRSLAAEYLIPAHLVEGVRNYVLEGVPPGGFLAAVIESDLFGAYGRADEGSAEGLRNLVSWFYNYAPSTCWGSPEKRQAWQKKHEELRLVERMQTEQS